MTSSYFETLGRETSAPVTASLNERFSAQMSEEVDLTESVNNEVDRLQDEKDRQLNLLIGQYNHMYSQPSRAEQFLDTLQKGSKAKAQIETYMDWLKPIQEFHRSMDSLIQSNPDLDGIELVKGLESIDTEMKRDHEVSREILQVKGEVEEIKNSGEVSTDGKIALTRGVVGPDGVGSNERESHFYESLYRLKKDTPNMLNGYYNGLKVPIPDLYIDGKQVRKTLAEASTIQEARYIANAIMYWHLYNHKDLTMGRNGRFKREVATPMLRQIDGLVAKRAKELDLADAEINKERRGRELQTRLSTDPGYAVDYVNVYKSVFNGDVGKAKADMARTVARYAEDGSIDRATVERVLETPFHARDSTPEKPHMVTIGDYWKSEAQTMLNGVAKYERAEADEINEQAKAALDLDVAQGLQERRQAKEPWTPERIHQWHKELMSTHKIPYEQLPDVAKNVYTATSVPDHDINWHLEQMESRGTPIQESDIQGIKDSALKAKWAKKIGGGINTKRRDSFIFGKVENKTVNTLGEAGRGDEWRAYQDNATLAFNSAWAAAKATGADDAEAWTAATEAVMEGLYPEKNPASEAWSKWGAFNGRTRDAKDRRNLGLAKDALAKDPSLLDSDKPWIGEEPHIIEALEYMKRGGALPVYYRNFPGIKRLPNGEVAIPYTLMRYRLNALGLLKDNKPIPEDSLPPELQELLRKPNPSKTLRVINSEEGSTLLKEQETKEEVKEETDRLYGPGPLLSAVDELRAKAQTAQQYALIDSSYRTLVNIPTELNDEFVAQVGELSPYSQLNNLAPEVAKAFIGDVLMT